MNAQRVSETARVPVADDKGLLAMEEGTAVCNDRFASWGGRQCRPGRMMTVLEISLPETS